MSDRPFTVADLADRWACSRRHIYNLIERGELKVFHAGGTLRRISAGEVARWESAGSRTELENTDSEPLESKPLPLGETPKESTASDLAKRQRKARQDASLARSLMQGRGRSPSPAGPR